MIELFEAAQRNDHDAFQAIWQNVEHRLASFVASRLGKNLREIVDVEDVVQETSIRAYESIATIQWQGEKAFFSWLCGVSLNVIRKASRRYLVLASEDSARNLLEKSAHRPSRQMRRNERFDRLEKALSSLADDHRQVIMLSRIEGLSVQEIAERMDRSKEAVYQLLWRALRKLKEAFGDTDSFALAERSLLNDSGSDVDTSETIV